MDDLFIFATRYIKFYSPLLLPPKLLILLKHHH